MFLRSVLRASDVSFQRDTETDRDAIDEVEVGDHGDEIPLASCQLASTEHDLPGQVQMRQHHSR